MVSRALERRRSEHGNPVAWLILSPSIRRDPEATLIFAPRARRTRALRMMMIRPRKRALRYNVRITETRNTVLISFFGYRSLGMPDCDMELCRTLGTVSCGSSG